MVVLGFWVGTLQWIDLVGYSSLFSLLNPSVSILVHYYLTCALPRGTIADIDLKQPSETIKHHGEPLDKGWLLIADSV